MKRPDPKHTLTLFDIIYQDADSDAIIATASRRPTRTDKEGNAPHVLEPIPIRDRREIIPQLFELAIEQTMYFMPNTLNQDALHRFKRYHSGNPPHYQDDRYTLEDYQARRQEGIESGNFRPLYFNTANHHVKQLVAITIDLDVGRDETDMTSDMAVGYALSLARYGEIPLPSLTAASGRGAYLLWLLKDAETGLAPYTTRENIDRWKKTTAELCKKLEEVKADRNATRLANWFKIPGTVDTKTDTLVIYSTHQFSTLAEIPRYDLMTLTKDLDLFDEPLKVKQLPEPDPRNVTFNPEKINARNVKPGKGAEPFEKRISEIELIAQGRQGIKEGLRENTLFYYYQLVRMFYQINLQDHQKAQQRTIDFNKHYFTPPLPRSELQQKIFSQKIQIMKVTNELLAYHLRVTVQEASKLGLQSILPQELVAKKQAAERRAKARRKVVSDCQDVIRESIIEELLNPNTNQSPQRIARYVTATLPPEVLRTLPGKEVSRQLVNKWKQKLKKEGQLPSQQQQELFNQ